MLSFISFALAHSCRVPPVVRWMHFGRGKFLPVKMCPTNPPKRLPALPPLLARQIAREGAGGRAIIFLSVADWTMMGGSGKGAEVTLDCVEIPHGWCRINHFTRSNFGAIRSCKWKGKWGCHILTWPPRPNLTA